MVHAELVLLHQLSSPPSHHSANLSGSPSAPRAKTYNNEKNGLFVGGSSPDMHPMAVVGKWNGTGGFHICFGCSREKMEQTNRRCYGLEGEDCFLIRLVRGGRVKERGK